MVNQQAVNITGHNLANATTAGYSRQEAVINPTEPFSEPALDSYANVGQLGTGVEVSSIRRVKDDYLDNNVRRTTTDSSYWEEQLSVLELAEASIAEPASDGIGDRMTDFFRSWMDLNNSPQDTSVKAAVVESGEGLASLLSYTYNQLSDVQDSIANIDVTPAVAGGKISDQVGEVNDLIVQIRDLTDSIKKVYDVGQQPNDLLDQRDMLLEKLSQYGPVNVSFETVDGLPTGELSELTLFGMDVSQAGTSFALTTDGTDISLAVTGGADDGSTINLTGSCFDTSLGGSLLGLERARQNVLDYMTKLDDLASNMESMIAGVGVDFFVGDLSTGDFAVDPTLLQNSSLIDGTLAGSVADLRDTQINPPAQPYTFEQYYGLLVTEVGSDVKVAGDMYDNQSAIKDQITSLRDSVSGVSTDEELTKLIQYQSGYEACAKLVTVLDEMLDLLINGLIN
jgi:flagellar hook-associated protein 1 FlgK